MNAQVQRLHSHAKCLALRLSGRQVVARGEASAWLADQAARYRLVAAQAQPFGLGLFALWAASSLGHVLTYIPSLFLALRANSSQREVLGV